MADRNDRDGAISRQERLRRVQFGTAGLIAVLLMVGLANLISGNNGASEGAGNPAVTATATEKADPLVELGVQPSGANGAANPAPPAVPDPAGTGTANQPADTMTLSVPDLDPDPQLEQSRKQQP